MSTTSRSVVRFIFLLAVLTVVTLGQEAAPVANAPAANAPSNAAQAPAQSPTQAPDGPLGTAAVLKVKTRLVVVDVVALDHKGIPVTDLKAEDFTLREENTGQKIRVFNFQQGTPPQGETATLVTTIPSPNRITNMPRFKTNSTLNVLLLDGINVTNQNQKYVHEQMLKFLEKLPAGQPIAVYALGTKLRMLQDFTTDPGQLKEVVKKAKDNALGIRVETSNAADLPPGILEGMSDAMLQAVLRFGQDQAINQLDQRVSLTLAQLGALARNLAGYPGRKNLIWISEAFPAFFVPSNITLGRNVGGSNPSQPLIKDYQGQINHAADLLSNAQVAVYPIDAGTLSNRDSYSSLSNTDSNGEYLGRSSLGTGRVGFGSQQATEINNSTENQIDSHSTMNSVADQTGGKAYYNTNNIDKAIHQSMDDGSTYYTLGYYPENKNWDGRFRRIAVTINRPGIKLHYRQGFFAVEPKDYIKQDPKILAADIGVALDINNPIATALPFQAVVLPPSEKTGNKVQVNFGVDPHAIGFELKADGLQHAAIDCGVGIYTDKGVSVRVQGNTFNAALNPEQYQKVMKMIFPCNQSLELPPGEYALRLAVRDDSNGLIGTANGHASVTVVAANQEAKPEDKKP
jgi:VWFA-related protein